MLADKGRSFLVTHSTAKEGKYSSIVSDLAQGSIVTTARTDIDMVVTEYGVAELKGKSTRERAKALISVAHPKFREELEKDARSRGFASV